MLCEVDAKGTNSLDSANGAKTQGMIRNVNKWVAAGVPIDGIGSQVHITGGQGSAAQGALQALASANVAEVAITELDIAQAPTSDYVAVSLFIGVEAII